MAAEKRASKAKPHPHKPAEWLPRIDQLYRFSVEQFRRMGEAGILSEDEHVELIGGVIVAKLIKNEPHTIATKVTDRALSAAIPAGWHVANKEPIALSDHDEPEPDLAIIRGNPRD